MLGAVAVVTLGAGTFVTLSTGPAMAAGPGCSGATIEVTTNTDAALRAAFTTANGLAGPQTICIDSGLGPITLGGTELVYNAATTPALTLQGNGVTISGANTSRILNVAAPLILDGVNVTDGSSPTGFGGAVFAGGTITMIDSTVSGNTTSSAGGVGGVFAAGSATLTNSAITGNTATATSSYGGLFANGSATLTNSSISDNTGTGHGGIFANGNVTLTNSAVSSNTASGSAGDGGMFVNGNVTLTASTVSGNTAADHGGIFANGNVTVTNSTISGNSATASLAGGGGVYAAGSVNLTYATVVGNAADGGANLDATGVLTSFGSVLTEPLSGGANCIVGSTVSQGFNFSDDPDTTTSCLLNGATDLVGAANDPGLGPLGNNGGPTATRLPATTSPLIDAIPAASCQDGGASGITTDQRGLPRPAMVGCDIGSVEVPTPPPASTTTAPGVTTTTASGTAAAATPVSANPNLTG